MIEHSLADDDAKDRFVIKSFTSLTKAESWFKAREREELSAREARPLLRCTKGVCTHNLDGGILHNHLYLKKSATAIVLVALTSRQFICSTVIESQIFGIS